MSLTPTTPASLSENLKSFWSRPEGKTGMIFLGIGGAAHIAMVERLDFCERQRLIPGVD